jgi:cyclopropane-fatty-acyl-phospholipid synthase
MLQNVISRFFPEGALIVRLPNGQSVRLNGAREADAPVIIRVRTYGTLWRLLLSPALAMGEAYVDGDVLIERGDLYDFLELCTVNFLRRRVRKRGIADDARMALRRWISERNARAAARRNVAHHYDLSGQLYRLFLDADRQYSCAYFAHPDMSLEQAQVAKKRHIAAKLRLEPEQRVLDIGSGWGGLGLSLANDYGAKVTGITLSSEQWAESMGRACDQDLADRVRFLLMDYRDVEGAFDRIVSVGMFEHVGRPNYQHYFDAVARLLKEDGVALVHTIGRSDGPGATNPWIAKYIFPGGYIPALSEILPAIERAGLIVLDVEVLRLHYAETLRHWRARFQARRDEARALYDERFCRMWDFYLAGSEASFRAGASVVFQIQLGKQNNAAPIVRDYITEADKAEARDNVAVAAE